MKAISLDEAQANLKLYIEQSQGNAILVTSEGRPVALIVGIEDEAELDSLLLAHNQRFVKLLDEARQRVRVDGGVSLDEMRRRLDSLPEE